jgi:acyl-coenzyme A synthetase/AMP-(fatty) acid ligase
MYTSGSTGKPKGVLHAIGGYMVYAAITRLTTGLATSIGDVPPIDMMLCI